MLPNIIPPAAALASAGIWQLVCDGGITFFRPIWRCTSAGDSQPMPSLKSRLLADVHITMSPPWPARSMPPIAHATYPVAVGTLFQLSWMNAAESLGLTFNEAI